MIPILFESTATSFSNNGIGRLSNAISCIVTEERNGPYELEMQYPISGVHFHELQHSRIIYATPADGKDAQPFRIYRIEKPLDGICTIYAEHISYELNHIPVKPFSAATCAAALNGLVTNSGQENPFTVWTNKSVTANYTLREPRAFRELLGGSQGSILDVYGKGEFEFDKFLVKLYVNRGTDRGVVIRYAKNITELVNDESIEEVYTGVCPFWASENGAVVMLPEVAIWATTAANFPYKRTKIVDFSEEFEEQPTVAQLRARAEAFIEDNDIGIPKVNIDVSFVPLWQADGASIGRPQLELVIPGRVDGDTIGGVAGRVEEDTVYLEDAHFQVSMADYKILERVHLCDVITVQYDALGVSYKAKVIKTVYDVLRDRYESIEVGDAKKTLASIVTDIDNDISRVESEVTGDDIAQRLMEYVDHQTELITGGLGGYVVLNPNANGEPQEILIMDTADMQSATNVIRMNQNGIGFSRTGYSGPFTAAWTIDGIFNTDFIGAGSITGAQIAANTITGAQIAANTITGAQIAANTITGAQIAAGSITAGKLSLYGKMGVFTNSALTTNGGYIGYMSGAESSSTTTNGIALMDSNGRNHVIATTSGVRMTNVDGSSYASVYVSNGDIKFTSTFAAPKVYLQGDVLLNTSDGASYSGATKCGENLYVYKADGSAVLFRASGASGEYGEVSTYNTSGRTLAYIGRKNTYGFVGTYNASGANQTGLYAAAAGGVLQINDATGAATRAYLFSDTAGGSLLLYNTGGVATVQANSVTYGGSISIRGNGGSAIANIYASQYGGVLALTNASGSTRINMYVDATSGGCLTLTDPSGTSATLTRALIQKLANL